MPIEFNCTNCGKLLRVPDGSEGKQGKCKDCNTVLLIPSGSAPAPFPAAAPAPVPAPAKPGAFPGVAAAPRSDRLTGSAPAGFSPNPAPMPQSNPYSSPAALGASMGGGGSMGSGGLNAVMPLKQAAGWMLFIGWFNIVIGVLYALTLIGIVFAWLPIWLGICLKNAGESLKAGLNERNVHNASKNLSTFFTIVGVLLIIQLVIMCLYLLVIVAILVFGLAAAAGAG